MLAADGEIAQQHQPGILAFDLAGVDAGLHEHDLLAGCARGFGREFAVLRRDDQHQVAAFGRDAETRQVDRARRRGGEALEIGVRFAHTEASCGTARVSAGVIHGSDMATVGGVAQAQLATQREAEQRRFQGSHRDAMADSANDGGW